MSESVGWECQEPFDVDHGELDGLSPQNVFCLGVEWQMFAAKVEAGEPFTMQVHTANVGRLKALCGRHGLAVKERWLHDDFAEWRILDVGGN